AGSYRSPVPSRPPPPRPGHPKAPPNAPDSPVYEERKVPPPPPKTYIDFNQKAIRVTRALHHLKFLLDALQRRLSDLTAFSDDLDKKRQKSKTMGIAGGTAGAVGGVAAVVGVVLAPVTMGISLVATAIGTGMVATAGGMGVRAAIADKRRTPDKASLERVLRDYMKDAVDAECCALVVRVGMDELRACGGGPELRGEAVLPEAQTAARLSRSTLGKDVSANLLQAFSIELELYFTEKKGQKLKRINERKFACRVRELAKHLQESLDELKQTWKTFSG
ncbi:hypothetical protein NHX12_031478, partial [Muraenolepis orangiensis]